MKTAISLGNEVVIRDWNNRTFRGIVVGKHPFSYDIYHGFIHETITLDDEYHCEKGMKISRYPKSRVFWISDAMEDMEKSCEDEDN